ncbi:hypothetical protein Mgra_00008410 [Meloidogyne graminicola]|uniref:Uncharacterized protein n=1 Tax=Meloidogyne graminicola TaxID=189291 RepID=A0A8S9ZFU2_9BILA|nr:hypothetical protein Mgra_00008410 [Meloidogyne graminicola]
MVITLSTLSTTTTINSSTTTTTSTTINSSISLPSSTTTTINCSNLINNTSINNNNLINKKLINNNSDNSSIISSKKSPNVPELKIENNNGNEINELLLLNNKNGCIHFNYQNNLNNYKGGGGGGGIKTPINSNNGICLLETPTPKIPDTLRTPTALLTSPTNSSTSSKSSQLMHIDELNTPLCLNSATPKSQHSQAFFGDHEPLLTANIEITSTVVSASLNHPNNSKHSNSFHNFKSKTDQKLQFQIKGSISTNLPLNAQNLNSPGNTY